MHTRINSLNIEVYNILAYNLLQNIMQIYVTHKIKLIEGKFIYDFYGFLCFSISLSTNKSIILKYNINPYNILLIIIY